MLRRVFLAGPGLLLGQKKDGPAKETVVYKKVGDLGIELDVYRPVRSALVPVIFFIHGGALISGDRNGIRQWQLQRYLDAGYGVVSIDYRLAPETKLPEILKDVEDAWAWLQREGPSRGFDVKRAAVVGHSAGGYLTLTCGYRCKPKPKALVAFYGYGEIAADWYAKPDPFYLKQPAVPEQEARGQVGSVAVSKPPANSNRGRFYLWCRQQGRWNQEVAGLDPATQNKLFDPYCPARNVTKRYPPTMLLHGDADTDVPFEQSEQMERVLRRESVEVEFIRMPGGAHGFDGRPEAQGVAEAFGKVLVFLRRQLR